ncbi:hypothetical protein BACPU_13040 [Bacillus pumilus]|nr:hypothetical protein BACPU_13040 [Bacillus pumilus]
MRIFSPIFNYVCMITLSTISATFAYTLIFTSPDVGIGYFQMNSLFILIAYLIFATPIQIVLHRYPAMFRKRDLFVYFIGAWVVCTVLALWIDYGLVVFISFDVYLFSFCAALIYWTWDSVFLMNKRLKRL